MLELKPAVHIGTAQTTTKNNLARPLDSFVNANPKTKPWMPPVQQFAKLSSVGVLITNQGEDRVGNIIVGAIGGAFGSVLLQFMVPPLSGFDDWRAIVSQWAAAFVSGALLSAIVRVVGRRQ
jgi:hypothetical protein